jgi:hypothetical protein
MATTTKSFCMSCVLDREIDPQTGRCLTCGHQALKAPSEPKADRNAGVPSRSPSQAYRTPAPATPPAADIGEEARAAEYERRRQSLVSASFDGSKTVAAVNGVTPAAEKEAPAPADARDMTLADTVATDAAIAEVSDTRSPSATWLAETRALADGFLKQAETAEAGAEEALAQAARFKAQAAALRKSAAVFSTLLGQLEGGEDSQAVKLPRLAWGRTHSGETFLACRSCGRSNVKHKARGYCAGCYRDNLP